jgi:hypothetical protein
VCLPRSDGVKPLATRRLVPTNSGNSHTREFDFDRYSKPMDIKFKVNKSTTTTDIRQLDDANRPKDVGQQFSQALLSTPTSYPSSARARLQA